MRKLESRGTLTALADGLRIPRPGAKPKGAV
jgi:hypothetical protein